LPGRHDALDAQAFSLEKQFDDLIGEGPRGHIAPEIAGSHHASA
jgi:hypothetical protein